MSKLRKSARGRDCTVRIVGICNFNPETTVLAHLGGGGMGRKKHDIHGAFCCSSCHSAIDGAIKTGFTKEYLELAHHQGVERTQDMWLEDGLITVKQ
ncbi:MAG: DUF1364 domain-containing protein [Desulfuromonadales bacterium]|nr:DUF1364 domain-containing protein [Desulfuromonadales bacterium]